MIGKLLEDKKRTVSPLSLFADIHSTLTVNALPISHSFKLDHVPSEREKEVMSSRLL